VDFQIPVHQVGDNLLNTVTDWHSYRLDNQNQTFTSRMRLRITQDRKKLRVSLDRARFDGTKPAEHFSFLRWFVRACSDRNVWEGKALYLVGSLLTGAAVTRFRKILPDTAGHIPGRTVASFLEAVHWLLVTYADYTILDQAVWDVNRASLGALEIPDAFAARSQGLGEACGNVYSEDRLKMVFVQGLPKQLKGDAQQYNFQFKDHTLSSSRRSPRASMNRSTCSSDSSRPPPRCTGHACLVGQDPRRQFWPWARPLPRPVVAWRAGAGLSRLLRPVSPGEGNVQTGYGRAGCVTRRTTSRQLARRCPKISRTSCPARVSGSLRPSPGQTGRPRSPPLDGGTRRRCTTSGSRSYRASRRPCTRRVLRTWTPIATKRPRPRVPRDQEMR